MKRSGRLLLLGILIACVAVPSLQADGKFYFRDDVPASQPFQRALLVHGDGREFLLIQPQLVGKARDFAWVVPAPSVPELGALDADDTRQVFWPLERWTQPHVNSWSTIAFWVVVIAGMCFSLLPRLRFRTRLKVLLGIAVLTAGHLCIAVNGRTLGVSPPEGVDVIGSYQLGIYDTTVVRSSDPAALRKWLEERGFRMEATDEPILRSYVERGWCFVASRISSGKKEVGEGLIDALAMSFASPAPVYPFALTAASGETDLVLYVLSDHRVAHPALETKFAGPREGAVLGGLVWPAEPQVQAELAGVRHWIEWAACKEGRPPPEMPYDPGYLTKFRARLSKKNMSGDLDLSRAPDDAPYQEVVWRW